ncbi:MAG TPA: 8-amino-7-oxononanoate synthase [Casimicrobiaceae bacterium]|nr:8-amino-7-oxononanoate synthase [Casimicrobiaceae bacterium]
MFAALAELERDLASRAQRTLLRERRVVGSAPGPRIEVDGRAVLAFASNDYLGLAGDPRVRDALCEGARHWGAGAGASHLLAGHYASHEVLERALVDLVAPSRELRALTFSTGYLANLAMVTALADRDAAIFADKLNHACLNDGALLSRAQVLRYRHCDAAHLAQRLASSPACRKLIVTDAVFSMDGDIAPLPALLELAELHDAWLLVDDAHGFGVLGEGRGSLAHFGLAHDRIVYMATLGKAAGVAGAFVLGHPLVIETILQTARSYIYTTAQPPALATALCAAVNVVRDDRARRDHLHALIARFRAGAEGLPWTLLPSISAIQPLVVGDAARAVALAEALWQDGLWVPAIRPPTVPDGTARLRVSLTAGHTTRDVDTLLEQLHLQARGWT